MAVTNTVTGKMNYLTVGSNTYEIEDKNAAPLASPEFTGTPTAPTAAAGTSTTQIATTKFVMDAMSGAGAGTVTSVGISNATNGGLSVSGSPVTSSGTISVGHSNVLASAQTTQAVYPIKIDKNGHISEYGTAVSITDENMKWTASTSSNTYYPLQSTSTATTGTANTLNSVSFYQYYNTAGGYRRLILGNGTAYTSTGGAYGSIRLYGAPATYYGDLVPGVLSTSSTGRLTANRTWTFPDATGTVALTSDIPTVPSATQSATTGISIAAHGTGTVIGVQSTTTSVTGVQSTTTTASKVTVGSSSTDYGVTATNTPTVIDTTKFNGGSYSHSGFSGGSFTRGSFSGGSLTMTMDTTDTKKLNITFTAATHGNDSFTAASYGTDSFTAASLSNGFYTAGTAATLGSKVPTVSASDVTVPIKNTSATTVPIKNTSSSTFVTGTTHTVTDNGHVHTL